MSLAWSWVLTWRAVWRVTQQVKRGVTGVMTTQPCTQVYAAAQVYTRWRKKRGQPISLQILWKFKDRIAWKLVNFCSVNMLNTVINFFV